MMSDRDPTFEHKPAEQAYAQQPIRVEKQPGGRARSDAPSSSGLGTILTSCVLALLMGAAGAWAYVDYLAPMLSKKQAQGSPADAQKSEPNSPDATARLNDLSGKLDELQARVDRLPKAVSPQDLEPLKERLAVVDELSRKVDSLGLRVNALPGKVDQDSRKITTLAADLQGVRNEVASLRNTIHTSASTEKPSVKAEKPSDRGDNLKSLAASDRPREIPKPARSPLQGGIDFFQKKHYDEASEFFTSLTKADPDDARVWYYAALSRGLATHDWKGETERLVTQGVEREKAGKPDKAKIDAAFAGLTSETGKDWLAFYRHRAD